jgi:hypothetical protein
MPTMTSNYEPRKHAMKPLVSLVNHGLYRFLSCFLSSSLVGMDGIVSLPASQVHHYWECFLLLHYMLHWFVIIGHGLHFSTS